MQSKNGIGFPIYIACGKPKQPQAKTYLLELIYIMTENFRLTTFRISVSMGSFSYLYMWRNLCSVSLA